MKLGSVNGVELKGKSRVGTHGGKGVHVQVRVPSGGMGAHSAKFRSPFS